MQGKKMIVIAIRNGLAPGLKAIRATWVTDNCNLLPKVTPHFRMLLPTK
jgi:hypothetical protein